MARTYSLPTTRPAVQARFTELGWKAAHPRRRVAGGTAFDEGVGIKNSVRHRRKFGHRVAASGCARTGTSRRRRVGPGADCRRRIFGL